MLPFTPAQFFEAFRSYNEAVWPAQWLLLAFAAGCLVLTRFPSPLASRAVSFLLALMWAWMAFAYHLASFAPINPAAYVFAGLFLAEAAAFAWSGVVRGSLRFDSRANLAPLGWALVALALVAYPMLGYALGHRYPSAPTFGVPCPTTLFTLGMLHFLRPRTPIYVFAVPILWSLIASVTAVHLGAVEDMLLLAAGLVSAVLLVSTSPLEGVSLERFKATDDPCRSGG